MTQGNFKNGIVIKNRSTFEQNCTFVFNPLQNEDIIFFFFPGIQNYEKLLRR